MQKNMIQALAVAGGLFAAVSAASAITLTTTGGSIDFDPATATFTNWQYNAINNLGATGLSYSGLMVNTTPLFVSPTGDTVIYNLMQVTSGPLGELTISFFGDVLAMDFYTIESFGTLSQTADFVTGYDQSVIVEDTGFGGGFVTPVAVGNTLTWNTNPRLPILFSSNIQLKDSVTTVIPEPITAALGAAGIALLGLRLTGRRGR